MGRFRGFRYRARRQMGLPADSVQAIWMDGGKMDGAPTLTMIAAVTKPFTRGEEISKVAFPCLVVQDK